LPRERPPATEERQPKRVATEAAATLQGPQLTAGGRPAGPAASTVSSGGAQADQRWDEAKAEVQRLKALGQQLQTEAQTKPTYTSFRETAKMAQDTFEAAEAASRHAGEERMVSVGALPMTEAAAPRSASGTGALGAAGDRLPGSGAGSGDGDRQQRSIRQGDSTRGAEARGGDGRQRRSGDNAAWHHAPVPSARKDGGVVVYCGRARTHRRDRRSNAWASDEPQLPAPSGGPQARATSSPTSSAPEDSGGSSNPGRTTAHQTAGGARAWTSDGHQTRASNGH
jgi:hypothetical protein